MLTEYLNRMQMIKYFILTFLICSQIQSLAGQTVFVDSLFHDISTTTITYATINGQALALDFYKAKQQAQNTPLIIYVHGGGFSGGVRDDQITRKFACDLAKRGYAVASVSYRLTMKGIGFGCDVDAQDKIDAIAAASYDVSTATQYLIENKDSYGIDTQKIILCGSSAGAEAVLHMAFVYDNPFLSNQFKFAGVIGMAGAIITLDKMANDRAIPTQLFHGTGDRLVPYGIAPHHYCEENLTGYLMLYGSEAIAQKLQGLNVSYYLYTDVGGTHDWAGRPMTECMDEIVDFLYHDILNSTKTRQTKRLINAQRD